MLPQTDIRMIQSIAYFAPILAHYLMLNAQMTLQMAFVHVAFCASIASKFAGRLLVVTTRFVLCR
jgi:hypothetical protein